MKLSYFQRCIRVEKVGHSKSPRVDHIVGRLSQLNLLRYCGSHSSCNSLQKQNYCQLFSLRTTQTDTHSIFNTILPCASIVTLTNVSCECIRKSSCRQVRAQWLIGFSRESHILSATKQVADGNSGLSAAMENRHMSSRILVDTTIGIYWT